MASIGKFTASGVSATNENNFSLISINADFSLLKVEAPVEYHGLGAALSRRRRENAEQGPLHRTARRLGALFEQILPPIQALAEAYGKRVSEISASEKLKGTGSLRDGPFASHVGVDGASIYAAATSGHGAIAVHLLACMLARTLSGPEAIALWVELVAERKKDIEKNMDVSQLQGMAAKVAAQQEISREDLAKWDASARAWLQSADEVKTWEKTQFRLITKDCGLLISSLGSTYASVLDVWTVAMTSMQKLILGMPQRISKAALLIGISSWHIYPDLNVVGPTVNVKFHDTLVASGGMLTLGLSSPSSDPDLGNGVEWSLSLSHLRFYGDPIEISPCDSIDNLRITMRDLHIAALGGILGAWGDKLGSLEAGVECFAALGDCYNKDAVKSMEEQVPWLDLLCCAARRYLNMTSVNEKANLRFLLSYGRSKGQNFLFSKTSERLFGLNDKMLLAECSEDLQNTHDSKEILIGRLRDLAQRCGFGFREGVILDYTSLGSVELTTVAPGIVYPYNSGPTLKHFRWTSERLLQDRKEYHDNEIYIRLLDADVDLKWGINAHSTYIDCKRVARLQWHSCPPELRNPSNVPSEYTFVAGDLTKAALFVRVLPSVMNAPKPRFDSTYMELTGFFRSSRILPQRIRRIINFSLARYDSTSLRALRYATSIYGKFPGVTVSCQVISHPLSQVLWVQGFQGIFGNASLEMRSDHDRRSLAFATIAWFETGSVDLRERDLAPVMAMACGNSIFVATSLLQDPSHLDNGSVTRLLGNLGRPGLVMLAPPQAPRLRSVDHVSWRLLNYSDFDGRVKDSFKDTSLHLSFTEYEIPMKVSIGAVDAEATMLETLVSVYDRDKWIADIDVLGASKKSFIC